MSYVGQWENRLIAILRGDARRRPNLPSWPPRQCIHPCRRPPELYPDGYQAWLKGRLPDGRRVRSPWAELPPGEKQMDERRKAPFPK